MNVSKKKGVSFIAILLAIAAAAYFLSGVPSKHVRAVSQIILLVILGGAFIWIIREEKG